jgi:hypothetical protein
MAEKINLPLDFFSGVNLSGINSDLYSDNPQTTGIDSSTKYNEGLLAGLIADIIAAQDPSNYRYGGYVSQGGLDIGEPNRQVINATPEQIAEALSKSKDMATAVLGSTVGSNQMLDDAAMAAAQAAAEEALSNISAEGGFSEAEANEVYDLLEAGTVTLNDVSRILDVPEAVVTAGYNQIKAERAAPEEVVDLTADTTANDLLTGGDGSLGDAADLDTVSHDSTVGQATAGGLQAGDVVTDDRIVGDYEYVYDAENNVFHYSPFDFEGNRMYTGETIDASTVSGFDPNTAATGTTKSVTFNPTTGEASIEQVGGASVMTEDNTNRRGCCFGHNCYKY